MDTNEGEYLYDSVSQLKEDEPSDGSSSERDLEGDDEGDLAVESSRVVIEKNDRSLYEFHRWHSDGRLNVEPEWQRHYVWNEKRASKLIESFLVDIPVPVVYLATTEDNKYEVIDGVQRLTSVFNFFDGRYRLSGLELRRDLNGKRFSNLPENLQNKLRDATLRAFELSPRTSKDLLFLIFERLNTGGVALNEMEIRNSIYRGRLNTLIKNLATYESFIKAVNQHNLSKRMNDRSLVLRFLAFYERHYSKATSGLKAFLNEYFETYRNAGDAKLEEYEKAFKKSMRSALTVFGENAFKLRKHDNNGAGEWSGKVNASIFQVVSVSLAAYEMSDIAARADAIYEEYLDLISSDVHWRDTVTTATSDATRIRYAFDTWNSRLAKVMEADCTTRDGGRIFSRTLKQEMFQDDRSCRICGQEIKSISDAALDHDRHYWRGGRTVPSNARLVHRICNATRPNS